MLPVKAVFLRIKECIWHGCSLNNLIEPSFNSPNSILNSQNFMKVLSQVDTPGKRSRNSHQHGGSPACWFVFLPPFPCRSWDLCEALRRNSPYQCCVNCIFPRPLYASWAACTKHHKPLLFVYTPKWAPDNDQNLAKPWLWSSHKPNVTWQEKGLGCEEWAWIFVYCLCRQAQTNLFMCSWAWNNSEICLQG